MRQRLRERKETHKQRSRLYRLGVGIAGGLLVIAGLLLSLPGVPGPGLLVAAVGLFLLALEFDRAERLLERLLVQLENAGERASRLAGWQKGLLVALGVVAGAGVLAVFVLWDVPVVPG
jgi:Flp pilus assembly protein TadB